MKNVRRGMESTTIVPDSNVIFRPFKTNLDKLFSTSICVYISNLVALEDHDFQRCVDKDNPKHGLIRLG